MKPCRDKNPWPKFAVYDIEAVKWINPVCLCHVDEWGPKGADGKPTETRKVFLPDKGDVVEQYVDWLVHSFKGEIVWAHWGGHYDHRFIIAEIFKRKWDWKTVQSGNLIVILTVRDPVSKREIKFCESARLMPDSVETIGKSVGLHKLDADRTNIEGLSTEEVVTYCYRDCDIVLKGLTEMRRNLSHEGFDFAFTLASMATRAVRRSEVLQWHRFYEEDPDNPGSQRYSHEFIAADKFCTPAYFGGRVEVFRVGEFRDLYYYDLTSSYPWSMTFPLPSYFIGYHPPLRDMEKTLSRCGISEATVTIPVSALHVPVLPVRMNGKVMFPLGRFERGRWTNLELLALWERIRDMPGAEITIHAQALYQELAFMRPFMMQFWKLRARAIQDGDEFKKYAYKIAMNACSGKLAENVERQTVLYGEGVDEAYEKYGADHVQPTKVPGVFVATHEEAGPFRHAAAAAYVTARSRLRLLEGLETCLRAGADVYYCDTDSIITDQPVFGLSDEKTLGGWHFEHKIVRAEIYCAKVYKFELENGTHYYKAKGMPIERREDRLEVPDLDNPGKTKIVKDTARIEERWRAFTAKFRGESLPKPTREGLRGFMTDLKRGGVIGPTTFTLQRSIQEYDNKRAHHNGASVPLNVTIMNAAEEFKTHVKRASARKTR